MEACDTKVAGMYSRPNAGRPAAHQFAAFTLVEVLFSVVIVGVLVVTMYTALASSIPMVRATQENERVTQIMSEKLDAIRLYNWTQITNLNYFLPTNFLVGAEALNTNSTAYYTGTISVAEAPIAEDYRSNLLQITVQVDWVSGSRPQSRTMRTYVAQYGLQSYIMR